MILEEEFKSEKGSEVDNMQINDVRWTINVSAVISFDETVEESESYKEMIELPVNTNDEDIEELLEREILNIFRNDNIQNGIIESEVLDLKWEELRQISPMKVMELEGEKRLFDNLQETEN